MITEIDGVRFCKHRNLSFWDYLTKQGIKKEEFEKFNPKNKLELILRWKWLTSDTRSAQECEETRQLILNRYKSIPPNTDAERYWYKNALYVESETNKVKAHFGLISQSEFEALEKETKWTE